MNPMFRTALTLLPGVLFSPSAFAVRCIPGDWEPSLCNLTEMPGTRCANAAFFASYCVAGTGGCEKIPGGCFGTTPQDHWYPIVEWVGDLPVPKWKCRCGCFAEETTFDGLILPTGRELVNRKNEEALSLGSHDTLDGTSLSEREINGIMHSPEKEPAITLKTQGGFSITLSQAHPVAIGDASGKVIAMKQAREVRTGDILINREGHPDAVEAISQGAYAGEMMNFNVKSTNPAHHLVVANGLKMGDIAWQTRLNNIDSRLLYRGEILKSIIDSEKQKEQKE